MAKLLEDSVGTYENILVALTFLGVLYLVMKQANLNVSVSKDGLTGFNTIIDSGNMAGYHPTKYESFSMGSMEAPSFHVTPFDPEMLDLVTHEKGAAGINYGSVSAPNNRLRVNQWQNGSGKAVKFDDEVIASAGGQGYVNHATEGFGYRKSDNMSDKLDLAAIGLGVSL